MTNDDQRETRGSEADFGLRFLAPARSPTVLGTDALQVLMEAGLPPRLDVPMAKALLAYGDGDAHRSFVEGLRLAPPLCPVKERGDGTLSVLRGQAPRRRDLGGWRDGED